MMPILTWKNGFDYFELINTYDLIESLTAIPIQDALLEHHAET
jgi:hypothetical protein